VIETSDLARYLDRAVTLADQHILEDDSLPEAMGDEAPLPVPPSESGANAGTAPYAPARDTGPTRVDVVRSTEGIAAKEALSSDEPDR